MKGRSSFNSRSPFAPWQTLFDVILPKHVLENETDLPNAEFNQMPIGFGPFKISENVQGDHMSFEAFDGYWQGRPKIDRLFIRFFGDATAMLQALKAKETDLAWQVSLSNIPELQQMESQGITTLVVPQPNPEQYAMNRDESQVRFSPIWTCGGVLAAGRSADDHRQTALRARGRLHQPVGSEPLAK